LNEAIFFYRKIGWYRERPFVPIYIYMYIETRGFFLCPNPMCSNDSEEQMAVGQTQRIPNVCDQREQIHWWM